MVKLETGLARKTIAVAISRGVLLRPVGLSVKAVVNNSGLPPSIRMLWERITLGSFFLGEVVHDYDHARVLPH